MVESNQGRYPALTSDFHTYMHTHILYIKREKEIHSNAMLHMPEKQLTKYVYPFTFTFPVACQTQEGFLRRQAAVPMNVTSRRS